MSTSRRSAVAAAAAVAIVALSLASGCDRFTSTAERLARVEQHLANADYRAAAIELQNVLDREPNNASAHLKMAEVRLQLGDLRSAESEIKAATLAGADRNRLALLTARLELALNHGARLLEQIDSGALSLAEPVRSIYRGRALLSIGQAQEAASAFAAALSADSTSLDAHIGLARAYIAQNKIEDAVPLLAKAESMQPDSADLWLVRVALFTRQGKDQELEQALLKSNEYGKRQLDLPQQVTVLGSLVELRLAQQDVPRAEAALNDLKVLARDSVVAAYLDARIAIAKHDNTTAANGLQQLITRVPDYTPARFLLGAVLIAQGSLNQAEQQLEQVMEQQPENLQALKLLAEVRRQLRRPKAAVETQSAAAGATSDDAQLNALLGVAHLELKQYQEAADAYERAAAIDPKSGAILWAFRAREAGKLPGGSELLKSWLVRYPKDTAARTVLAMAYQAAGDDKGAEKAYEEVLATDAKNAVALNNLAGLYQKAHNPKAVDLARQAYALAPANASIADTYGWILLDGGQVTEAVQVLKAAAGQAGRNATVQFHYAVALARSGDRTGAVTLLKSLLARPGQFADEVAARGLLQELDSP